MKIVIDIDENLYSYISKEDAVYFPDDGGELFETVKNGTPLKGHGRLIDADALNEAYTYECISECDRCEHCSKDGHGCELLLNATTIIEADKAESEADT